MSRNQLKVGSVLQATVDVRMNNGESLAPAMVTRVLDADEDSNERVNLRVFLDTGADLRYANVPVVSDPPESEDENSPERVAFWP